MSVFDISLNISGNVVLLVAIALAAIGFSYFVYRETVPPVSRFIRALLMSLRATVAVLVLLLLFEPILSLTQHKKETPLVAVLIDQSASMNLADQGGNRREALSNVLDSDFFQRETEEHDRQFFLFSHSLSGGAAAAPDSFSLAGDGTDIQRALQDVKDRLADRHLTSVVLITDGGNNLGENPARYAAEYGLPIYPIAVGDPAEQSDILVSNYLANEIAYAGTRVPVDILVKSTGFEGKKVPVTLTLNGDPLDTKTITLTGDGLEQKVRLHLTPENEGLQKYEIKLPNLDGELTPANNMKAFYIRVLKSKVNVLVIAGGPGPDFSFVRRALAADENIEVRAYVEKLRGAFYQSQNLPATDELAKSDCVILLDFPRATSSPATLNKIKTILAKGRPLLLLWGRGLDPDKLWEIKDFTPLVTKPRRVQERSVYIDVQPMGLQHPAFRLSEDAALNREKWQELPPVFTNLASVSLNKNAAVLAGIDRERSPGPGANVPLVVALTTGKRKSLTVLAYGLWRWDLLMWGVGKNNDSYVKFLQNSIRWLSTNEESKLVRITANKEIYRSGEEIRFTAQVYFEDFKPVEGAEVVVQIEGAGETEELSLKSTGGGRYEGRLQVLEGGDYRFSGTAHLQGQVVGRDAGQFLVEAFSLEYQNTRMNEELLRRIAAESGGNYFTSSDFGGLMEKLSFPDKEMIVKRDWEIWSKTPFLVTCILLLTAEWFIRKRKGML